MSELWKAAAKTLVRNWPVHNDGHFRSYCPCDGRAFSPMLTIAFGLVPPNKSMQTDQIKLSRFFHPQEPRQLALVADLSR
jgi:hypothetical protein